MFSEGNEIRGHQFASKKQHFHWHRTKQHDTFIPTPRSYCKWSLQSLSKAEIRSMVRATIRQAAFTRRVEDIEMKFHLTEIKPIYAKWMTQFYDYMSTEDGSKVITNGWKKSGISDAVTSGSSSLPSLDSFQTISPLPQLDGEPSETTYPSNVLQDFFNVREDDDDSDWGDNDVDFERNSFDFIIDDE